MNLNNIEEIISRLKEEGVIAGEKRGDEIINQAEKKAHNIINEAEKKASQIISAAEKEKIERDVAAKYALEIAAKGMIHSTAMKISEILDIALKEKIKEKISTIEVVEKLIKGEQVDVKELFPLMRDKILDEGAEIEYNQGKIKIFVKDKNFHYEISAETIVDSYKSYIREELHEILFPVKR